jgi:hypothetical protein
MSSINISNIYKYPKRSFPRLITHNYVAWKGNMSYVLRALLILKIIDRTEDIPPIAAPGVTLAQRAAAEHQWTNYIQHYKNAVAAISNTCSIGISIYINDIDDLEDIWLTLREQCNAASTVVGHQALYQQFISMKPIPGTPIRDNLSSLVQIYNQIMGSSKAISDIAFQMYIFSSLPPIFEK